MLTITYTQNYYQSRKSVNSTSFHDGRIALSKYKSIRKEENM